MTSGDNAAKSITEFVCLREVLSRMSDIDGATHRESAKELYRLMYANEDAHPDWYVRDGFRGMVLASEKEGQSARTCLARLADSEFSLRIADESRASEDRFGFRFDEIRSFMARQGIDLPEFSPENSSLVTMGFVPGAALTSCMQEVSHWKARARELEGVKEKFEALQNEVDQLRNEVLAKSKAMADLEAEALAGKTESTAEKPLSERERMALLRLAGALLEYIKGQYPGVNKHPSFETEAKLIEAISTQNVGIGGLSKSNLQRKIPEAKRALDSQ